MAKKRSSKRQKLSSSGEDGKERDTKAEVVEDEVERTVDDDGNNSKHVDDDDDNDDDDEVDRPTDVSPVDGKHKKVNRDDDDDDDEEQEEQEEEEQDDDDDDDDEDDNQKQQEGEGEDPPFRIASNAAATSVSDGRYRNKQRCLTLSSRGVTARFRHLLEDLRTLLPHHKKEPKLDPDENGIGQAVSDIAEIRSCSTVLFLECRKRQDAYMWIGRVGGAGSGSSGGKGGGLGPSSSSSGPSAKFHVTNIHTMDELRLTGNCMKGSRPLLTFDESFTRIGHLKLLKELFVDVFGTPRGHPKSKPFVDRVMAFCYADKKIWVRNYQILEQQASNAFEAHAAKKQSGQEQATSLVEIGPRFVLNTIRIFRGSFGGQTLYRNPDFVSPNDIRAMERRGKGNSFMERVESRKKRKYRQSQIVIPDDPLDSVFR